jgi:hypothetical protein
MKSKPCQMVRRKALNIGLSGLPESATMIHPVEMRGESQCREWIFSKPSTTLEP